MWPRSGPSSDTSRRARPRKPPPWHGHLTYFRDEMLMRPQEGPGRPGGRGPGARTGIRPRRPAPDVRPRGIRAATGKTPDSSLRPDRIHGLWRGSRATTTSTPVPTDRALQRYQAFLRPPGRRPLYPQDAECSCRGCSFDDVRHAVEVLEEVLLQLPPRPRTELKQRVWSRPIGAPTWRCANSPRTTDPRRSQHGHEQGSRAARAGRKGARAR